MANPNLQALLDAMVQQALQENGIQAPAAQPTVGPSATGLPDMLAPPQPQLTDILSLLGIGGGGEGVTPVPLMEPPQALNSPLAGSTPVPLPDMPPILSLLMGEGQTPASSAQPQAQTPVATPARVQPPPDRFDALAGRTVQAPPAAAVQAVMGGGGGAGNPLNALLQSLGMPGGHLSNQPAPDATAQGGRFAGLGKPGAQEGIGLPPGTEWGVGIRPPFNSGAPPTQPRVQTPATTPARTPPPVGNRQMAQNQAVQAQGQQAAGRMPARAATNPPAQTPGAQGGLPGLGAMQALMAGSPPAQATPATTTSQAPKRSWLKDNGLGLALALAAMDGSPQALKNTSAVVAYLQNTEQEKSARQALQIMGKHNSPFEALAEIEKKGLEVPADIMASFITMRWKDQQSRHKQWADFLADRYKAREKAGYDMAKVKEQNKGRLEATKAANQARIEAAKIRAAGAGGGGLRSVNPAKTAADYRVKASDLEQKAQEALSYDPDDGSGTAKAYQEAAATYKALAAQADAAARHLNPGTSRHNQLLRDPLNGFNPAYEAPSGAQQGKDYSRYYRK